MVGETIRFVVESQGCLICDFEKTELEEAKQYVKYNNLNWLEYVQRCADNFEPYADNECRLYREFTNPETGELEYEQIEVELIESNKNNT